MSTSFVAHQYQFSAVKATVIITHFSSSKHLKQKIAKNCCLRNFWTEEEETKEGIIVYNIKVISSQDKLPLKIVDVVLVLFSLRD